MIGIQSTTGQLRLLCLGAHCDDIEIGCGGTILQLAEHYPDLECWWVVFSSNEQREQEARRGADVFLRNVRTKHIVVERYPDGFFPYVGADIKTTFEDIKQRFTPDLIFTHYRDDRHQDHRVISDLTWNTWRQHMILEYEIPKYDGDVGTPNVYVPLSEQTCQQKVRYVLDTYTSQADKHWFTADTFMALLRLRGIESPHRTQFAEAFYGRKLSFKV